MARRLINRRPDAVSAFVLAALPFVLLIAAYFVASAARLADNPNDKLLPSAAAFGDAIVRMAVTPDRRTGDILLWTDTAASLTRLGVSLAIATVLGLAVGVATGLIPYVRATMATLVTVLSMIPPLTILPILFILFGTGEAAKIVLIVFGIAPFMVRDITLRVGDLPTEQIIKAQTLGASTWQIALRVVLPQVFPRLIDALRLSLGPAWLFLIASEAIAAAEGLGYRIFLVRRYLSMDVILPYVFWITLLAFTADLALRGLRWLTAPWLRGT